VRVDAIALEDERTRMNLYGVAAWLNWEKRKAETLFSHPECGGKA
jgi:hypothetical protein